MIKKTTSTKMAEQYKQEFNEIMGEKNSQTFEHYLSEEDQVRMTQYANDMVKRIGGCEQKTWYDSDGKLNCDDSDKEFEETRIERTDPYFIIEGIVHTSIPDGDYEDIKSFNVDTFNYPNVSVSSLEIFGAKVIKTMNFKCLFEVKIRDSLTEIGERFLCDSEIKYIYFPNTVRKVGVYFMNNCKDLEIVRFPNKSLEFISSYFLNGCKKLREFIMPNSVKTFDSCFMLHCENLESIRLSNSITRIESFFMLSCKNIKSITIPDSVTDIGYKFMTGCLSLNSIVLSNSLKFIGSEFMINCRSIEMIKLPESIESIGLGFMKYCDRLDFVCVPRSLFTKGILLAK